MEQATADVRWENPEEGPWEGGRTARGYRQTWSGGQQGERQVQRPGGRALARWIPERSPLGVRQAEGSFCPHGPAGFHLLIPQQMPGTQPANLKPFAHRKLSLAGKPFGVTRGPTSIPSQFMTHLLAKPM